MPIVLPNNYEHMAVDSITWELVSSLNIVDAWVGLKLAKLESWILLISHKGSARVAASTVTWLFNVT